MPDVIIHHLKNDWLVLIEAVTSHGPINPKRKKELEVIFANIKIPLVMVTTFLSRKAMVEYLPEIAWETDVWVAEDATHLIHYWVQNNLRSPCPLRWRSLDNCQPDCLKSEPTLITPKSDETIT